MIKTNHRTQGFKMSRLGSVARSMSVTRSMGLGNFTACLWEDLAPLWLESSCARGRRLGDIVTNIK